MSKVDVPTATVAAALERWLLSAGPPPGEAALRDTGLAPFAYTVLPAEHPMRARLRADYLASAGRHEHTAHELAPLLRAWRSGGVSVLLFKGFQLSEFVYPQHGARFYGDVDILLRPEHARRAERIAADLGWHSARPRPFTANHMAFLLGRPGGASRVDAHQQAIHVRLPWHPVQQRITAAVWRDSHTRWWRNDLFDVREPSPVDMLLVGLVLQRCWGYEEWQLKPHDVVDFRYITSRYEVTRAALWKRARVLGCDRTLAAFLERCDPEAARLDLSPLPVRERRRLNRRAFPERGLLGGPEHLAKRAWNAPSAGLLALRFLPVVLHVRWLLQRRMSLKSMLRALAIDSATHVGPRDASIRRENVVTGVRWASRLVGSGVFGGCLLRALATCVALRRLGWPVEFVSGVRRADSGRGIVGHAWVEYEGLPLLEMEPDGAAFEPMFRFPATRAADRAPSQAPSPIASTLGA